MYAARNWRSSWRYLKKIDIYIILRMCFRFFHNHIINQSDGCWLWLLVSNIVHADLLYVFKEHTVEMG